MFSPLFFHKMDVNRNKVELFSLMHISIMRTSNIYLHMFLLKHSCVSKTFLSDLIIELIHLNWFTEYIMNILSDMIIDHIYTCVYIYGSG